jgi:hypothetical protein
MLTTMASFAALLAGGLFLSGASAMAFDCAGVKLPSSMVICSDPELMRLADERQMVLNQVRWGLDPQVDRQLLADQTAWVHGYATACGVPPNRPAPNPIPSTIKECFRRAGEARIAYLRAYGGSAPPAAAPGQMAPEPAQTRPQPADKLDRVLRGLAAQEPTQTAPGDTGESERGQQEQPTSEGTAPAKSGDHQPWYQIDNGDLGNLDMFYIPPGGHKCEENGSSRCPRLVNM